MDGRRTERGRGRVVCGEGSIYWRCWYYIGYKRKRCENGENGENGDNGDIGVHGEHGWGAWGEWRMVRKGRMVGMVRKGNRGRTRWGDEKGAEG